MLGVINQVAASMRVERRLASELKCLRVHGNGSKNPED